MTDTSVFTSETMMVPSGKPFRGSDLQRQYRAVLDSARISPVQVLDKDGHRLALADWDEIATAWTFMRLLDQVAQFQAAYEQHREQEPAEWVGMTPFPFLACFERDDVDEFNSGLLPYLMESVRRRDLEGFLGNLRAWESSAETYDDREMLAQMNDADDRSGAVEVIRPT